MAAFYILCLALPLGMVMGTVPPFGGWGPPPVGGPVDSGPSCIWSRIFIKSPCSVSCGEGEMLRATTLIGFKGDASKGVNCSDKLTYVSKVYYPADVNKTEVTKPIACNLGKCPSECAICTGPNVMGCSVEYDANADKNVPRCQCKPGFTGTDCKQANDTLCKVNPCGVNGTCFIYGDTGVQSCICPPTHISMNGACVANNCTQCALNNTVAGFPCKIDSDDGSVVCHCTGLWGGENCTLPRFPANNCSLDCGNNGKCIDVSDYGVEYCQCKNGAIGSKCETIGNYTSKCQPINVLNCILGATETDKCRAVDTYIKCAQDHECNDMVVAWCATGVPGCPRSSKCPTGVSASGCNPVIYEACYSELRRQVSWNSTNTVPCVPSLYATCAAAANCPDLLNAYCKRTFHRNCPASVAGLDMPDECNWLDSSNPTGMMDDHPHERALGSGYHLSKSHDRKSTVFRLAVVGVGAFVAVAATVVVALAIVRRRRAQESINYSMM